MKEFRLFENETPNQAIYRVCKCKDEIGTWEDVRDILNDMLGENFSSSAYRKKFQCFEQIMKDNEDLFFENKNYLDDLKEMKREIQKEKIKLSDERTELKRLYREQARRESFLDVVKRAMAENVKPLVEQEHIGGFNYSDNDLIVSLTDIHTGIEIDNAFNKFNESVLRKRFNTYLQKILASVVLILQLLVCCHRSEFFALYVRFLHIFGCQDNNMVRNIARFGIVDMDEIGCSFVRQYMCAIGKLFELFLLCHSMQIQMGMGRTRHDVV